MKTKPNILFLADTTHKAGAVSDHIRAVAASEQFSWHIMNPLSCRTIDKLDLHQFDAIGIHFSIKLYDTYYLSTALKRSIKRFDGVKFVFIQDEYQKVDKTESIIQALGFTLMFSIVRPELRAEAYPRLSKITSLTMHEVLTGYVDESLKAMDAPPIKERKTDVFYRSRRCDYRLGMLGHEKAYIAEQFPKYAKAHDLTLDISVEESARIYGDAWLNALKSAKVVLGTESGASIWDRSGEVNQKIRRYLRKNPKASFEDVHRAELKPYEGNVMYSAISPRVFEAAAAKACMVMFEGEYSGVCKPDEHYIPLKKDFSNMDEVLSKIKDDALMQSIADKAHQDLIASGLYAKTKLAGLVEQSLTEAFASKKSKTIEASAVQQAIKSSEAKYKLLNLMRCFKAEASFILLQFFRLLLLEPSQTWGDKLGVLTEGVKRYLLYLKPRVVK